MERKLGNNVVAYIKIIMIQRHIQMSRRQNFKNEDL